MITPGTHDITVYTGASFELEVTLQDAEGAPVDLTHRTIEAQIWNEKGSRLLAPLTVVKTAATQGLMQLTLTPEQSVQLPVDRNVSATKVGRIGTWDLRVTEPDGTTVNYWLQGLVYTNHSVTEG